MKKKVLEDEGHGQGEGGSSQHLYDNVKYLIEFV